MDHTYINEFKLVDRYLLGELAADEGDRFEAHFTDCPQCLKHLQKKKTFGRDRHAAGSQDVTWPQAHRFSESPRLAPSALLQRPLLVAAAGLLLVALISTVVMFIQLRHWQGAVDQAQEIATEWQSLSEQAQQSARLALQLRDEKEQELTERLRQFETDQPKARPTPLVAAAGPGVWQEPQINLPIFVLSSVRSSQPNPAAPINELTLPPAPAGFAISLALEGEVKYQEYRITIRDSQNRLVWQRGEFQPDRYNSLSMGFTTPFFRPGNYRLTVEGLTSEGAFRLIGHYPLRIIKQS